MGCEDFNIFVFSSFCFWDPLRGSTVKIVHPSSNWTVESQCLDAFNTLGAIVSSSELITMAKV
jgi:hypothetical protein